MLRRKTAKLIDELMALSWDDKSRVIILLRIANELCDEAEIELNAIKMELDELGEEES